MYDIQYDIVFEKYLRRVVFQVSGNVFILQLFFEYRFIGGKHVFL